MNRTECTFFFMTNGNSGGNDEIRDRLEQSCAFEVRRTQHVAKLFKI